LIRIRPDFVRTIPQYSNPRYSCNGPPCSHTCVRSTAGAPRDICSLPRASSSPRTTCILPPAPVSAPPNACTQPPEYRTRRPENNCRCLPGAVTEDTADPTPKVHRNRASALRPVYPSASQPRVHSYLAAQISSYFSLLLYKRHWGVLQGERVHIYHSMLLLVDGGALEVADVAENRRKVAEWCGEHLDKNTPDDVLEVSIELAVTAMGSFCRFLALRWCHGSGSCHVIS